MYIAISILTLSNASGSSTTSVPTIGTCNRTPVDRWLKLPRNMDRYRFTGGFGYATGRWEIDTQFLYSMYTHDDYDTDRTGLSGIVWFTRFVD